MNKTETIKEQAERVIALRKELSTAERNLAEQVAQFQSEGNSFLDLSLVSRGAVKWALVEAATKRLKAAA